MPNIPPASQRLSLEVAGLDVGAVSADVISIRYVETLRRGGSLCVVLANWGGSPPGYTYSEDNALHFGAQVKLFGGDVPIAQGTITTLMPHFDGTNAPTLAFVAKVKRPRAGESAQTLPLAYGASLFEFHPTSKSTANLHRKPIVATGVAAGLPSLRVGVRVDIVGVGTRWAGSYSVTDATHSSDSQAGYRVEFTCSR